MDKRWSAVCALIVIFSAVRTVDSLKVRCPWRPNLALLHTRCEDCPIDHICCVYDGEDVCIPPASKKPGMCPHRPVGPAACVVSCSDDADCPDNKKCCFSGCGRECMAPVTEYCPWHLNLALSCKGCEDCPRDHKCCIYDGEEYCVPPVSTKPGFCPRRRFDIRLCVESCFHDSDCPNNEKCCFNGCGQECKPPAID